jgi:phosphatidylglycerophosphate synthase
VTTKSQSHDGRPSAAHFPLPNLPTSVASPTPAPRVVKYEAAGIVDAVLYPAAWKATPVFWRLGFTPNWVTSLSIAIALVSCGLFLAGYSISAAALFVVYYFLDLVDGSLARRFQMKSDLGEAYDFVKDAVLFNLFACAILSNFAHDALFISVLNSTLGIHLLVWQGSMERNADPNHYAEKRRRFMNRNPLFTVYLALVWLYTFCGRVASIRDLRFFRWLGTGEFVLVIGMTMFFNVTWILSTYTLIVVLLYAKEFGGRLFARKDLLDDESLEPLAIEPLLVQVATGHQPRQGVHPDR